MEELPSKKKPVKTYVKTRIVSTKSTKSPSKSLKPERKVLIAIRKPLTTKKAVELLIKGTLKRKVCRYCLNIAYPLSDLDQCFSIGGQGALYNVTIRDMVASLHPFKVVDNPNVPNKICPNCVNQALHAYLFAQQCEQAERALSNCLDDMYNKIQKLDPLERTKKRGRCKNYPNHNIIHAEHAKVIDYAEPIRNLINSGSVSYTNEPEMSKLECKKCWQVLPDIESLANHEKIHPKTMWYHCRLCGQSFVKSVHIRKHLKSVHGSKSQPMTGNENFMCKQCGFTSGDYNTHLQHIEKHKFKCVMEHLVQRKMDELCSVCLDKGALQDLEKTVRLHGAYPELTGIRSLYNILGSAIPEKEKHKFKELLVPSYANVITITKKAKTINNNTFVRCNQVKKLDKNIFSVSDPFIVSKESVEDKDLYLFTFSKPIIPFQITGITIEDNKVGKLDESLKKNGDHDVLKISVIDVDEIIRKELNFVENNVDFIEEADVTCSVENKPAMTTKELNVNETAGDRNKCQFCWVFKRLGQCDKCKTVLTDNNIDVGLTNTKYFEDKVGNNTTNTDAKIENSKAISAEDNWKECKYCWVFKTIGLCSFCQTSFKKNPSTKTETVAVVVNIPEDLNNDENKTQKRKTNETINKTNNKKARWECPICLSFNNDNRELCLCCDSYALKDSLKINFGSNTRFFKGINEVKPTEMQERCTDVAKNIEKCKNSYDFVFNYGENKEITENNNKTKAIANDIETSKNCYGFAYNSDENKDINGNNIKTIATFDTSSIIDQAITKNNYENIKMQYSNDTVNEKLHQEEAMDIDDIYNINKPISLLNYCNLHLSQTYSPTPNFMPNPIQNNSLNILMPTPINQTSSNTQPKTFQFNIGSSFQDTKPARSFKRSVRRTATKSMNDHSI